MLRRAGRLNATFFKSAFFCVFLLCLPRISGAEQASEGFSVKMICRGPDTQTLRMRFVGSDPTPEVVRLLNRSGPFNDSLGARPSPDPVAWRTGSAATRRVVYRSVYPGIDLVTYGRDEKMQYDLIVSPWADLGRVQIQYEGLENCEIEGVFPGYQIVDGVRVEVPVSVEKGQNSAYRLVAADHDRGTDLVIPTTSVTLQLSKMALVANR